MSARDCSRLWSGAGLLVAIGQKLWLHVSLVCFGIVEWPSFGSSVVKSRPRRPIAGSTVDPLPVLGLGGCGQPCKDTASIPPSHPRPNSASSQLAPGAGCDGRMPGWILLLLLSSRSLLLLRVISALPKLNALPAFTPSLPSCTSGLLLAAAEVLHLIRLAPAGQSRPPDGDSDPSRRWAQTIGRGPRGRAPAAEVGPQQHLCCADAGPPGQTSNGPKEQAPFTRDEKK